MHLSDLTYQGALEFVRPLHADNTAINRLVEILGVAGFVNSKGHRNWNRERVTGLLDGLDSNGQSQTGLNQ